jgi:hypothetical protein
VKEAMNEVLVEASNASNFGGCVPWLNFSLLNSYVFTPCEAVTKYISPKIDCVQSTY